MFIFLFRFTICLNALWGECILFPGSSDVPGYLRQYTTLLCRLCVCNLSDIVGHTSRIYHVSTVMILDVQTDGSRQTVNNQTSQIIRIFNGCEVLIENSVIRVTVWH